MCDETFLRYLLSFDNLIVDPAKFDHSMDMDKPLAHYFIASSHNTYLTGSFRKKNVFLMIEECCFYRIAISWSS